MKLSNSLTTQWGKLTSLNPDFSNIPLSKNPSSLAFTSPLQENRNKNSSNSQDKCQIYQDKHEYFISYTGDSLAVQVNNKTVKEGKAFKISSGDRMMVTHKNKNGEKLEYIFSSELRQSQKETLKRDREVNEELAILGKKAKFQEVFDKESKCLICEKMIYECVSVVPCLHSFCMDCFMEHLRGSQDCPECGERFLEFRKNIFLNNLIEGYEESGYERDRSPEECRQINEKLNTDRVFARFKYANEDLYEGEWKKCKRDGDWRNGLIEGKGKGIFAAGHIYEGDFKGNNMEGKGKMRWKAGDFYEGEWKNNKKEGRGKMVDVDGDIYEGEWKNGKKEGKGKIVYAIGDIYVGEWENGEMKEQGKMVYLDGDVYEGDWKDEEREGKGKMIYTNGNIYEGEWKNGKRKGKGKMVFADGGVYEGCWSNDKREGKGKMTFADGRIYTGGWRNNKREGYGKMTFTNGSVSEGKWKNNKIEPKDKKKNCYGKNAKKKKRR